MKGQQRIEANNGPQIFTELQRSRSVSTVTISKHHIFCGPIVLEVQTVLSNYKCIFVSALNSPDLGTPIVKKDFKYLLQGLRKADGNTSLKSFKYFN